MTFRPFLFCFSFLALTANAAEFDHKHQDLTKALKTHVRDGRVAYQALKSDRSNLNAYLTRTEGVKSSEFDRWNQDQQIAYLVNVYNARTLELILDNYPLKSIKKIGWLPGAAWRKKFVPLFGSKVSLGHIEHEILRKKYNVPEIHFALVCAARGCPPLRNEAYSAGHLNEQLAEQGRGFLGNSAKNRVSLTEKRVYLSPIFDWFKEDFEKKSGSVTAFVKLYLPRDQADKITDDFRISYTEYDWSLNELP